MPVFPKLLLSSLFAVLLLVQPARGAEPAAAAAASTPGGTEVEQLLAVLEDPAQRDALIARLKLLAEAARPADDPQAASFRTAAADLVESLADRAQSVGQTLSEALISDGAWDDLYASAETAARDPETRKRWLLIAFRLAAVLVAGFVAAWLVRWIARRATRSWSVPSLRWPARALRLSGRLLFDGVAIAAFALAAYATLTAVDPHQHTRLVVVALINASILSRAALAVSRLLFSPDDSNLRLWQIGDETAHYIHHWVRRLALLSLYGFFGLQAAVLLGLDGDTYQVLLHLLGLVLLALLLIMVAQNRTEVAEAFIAPQQDASEDQPRGLASLRKGIARIWHLVAAAYLIAVYAIWTLQIEDGAWFITRATLVSLVVLTGARLLLRAVHQLFERGLSLSEDLRRQLPQLEARLNRYFPLLRKALKGVIVIISTLLIIDAWGIDVFAWLGTGSGRVMLAALVNIALILAVSALAWEVASGIIERHLAERDAYGNVRSRSARIRTLLTVARNALMIVLSVVAVLMVLSELGINIAPLLAGAGVVGLAIGFGAQRLVQDVINGAFILFQDLMSVGDVVKLGDKGGVVEALSIRTVRLRDLAGVVHTIPFSSIEAVSNLTREYAFHVFDLGIAYREDVDQVVELVRAIGEELRADKELGALILEPIEVFGLDAFGDSALVIKGRIKTLPLKQWQVGRAFNRLVKIRFDEHNIEIPFPHTTLYFGQDKHGKAPPAFVELEGLVRDARPANEVAG